MSRNSRQVRKVGNARQSEPMSINKEARFLNTALTEMFRRVGRKYSAQATSEPDWYCESTWTSQQQAEFVKWLANLIRRELKRRAYRADREAGWFVLNYGWKVKEHRTVRESAPASVGKRK